MHHRNGDEPHQEDGSTMCTRFEDLKFMLLLSAVTLLGSGLDVILR